MGIRRGSISTPIIADGLTFNIDAANRACYPRTGTTATDTVGNIAGTLSGASGDNNTPQWENTNHGIFDFDGTDDFINSNRTFSDPVFTISVWFKAAQNGVTQYMISTRTGSGGSSRGFAIFLLSNNLYFDVYNSGQARVTTGFTDTTNFNHALLVYDGSTNASYLNGSLIGTDNHSYGASTANMAIAKYTYTTIYFNGQVGNVHFYNRALSSTEVLHNYNALKGRFGL